MSTNLLRPIKAAALAVALLTAAVASPQQQVPPVIPGQAAAQTPPAAQAPAAPPASPQQQVPPIIPGQAAPQPVVQTPAAPAPPAATPAAAPAPQPPAVQPPAAAPAPQPTTVPAQPAVPGTPPAFSFDFSDASLTEFIDTIARHLKLNYILDPAVVNKGSVSLYTYGEVRPTDLMTLLQTVLRVNGMTIVQVGDIYRIIPAAKTYIMPLSPMVNGNLQTLPADERMVLNLIFLKYATAPEIDKLIAPFLGEGATHSVYEAANLLILQDNARNMRRTMSLVDLFDSDTFAGQRVHLFEVSNSRPSEIAKELDTVFKAYAMSEKSSPVKFLPVDRINTVIAVAPNPGIFIQVKEWIDKFDVAVKSQAGEVSTYVYRLKYGRAETTAMAITALYTGNVGALMAMAMMTNGAGGMGGGMNGGMGGGMSGFGGMNYSGGSGGAGFGNAGFTSGGSAMGGSMNPNGYNQGTGASPISVPQAGSALATGTAGPNTDITGQYLTQAAMAANRTGERIPHIIPNPFDNTLLIQANPQEWAQINNLLRQIDIAPRQVLIEVKIYELDLTGAFSEGISAYMQQVGSDTGLTRALNIATGSGGLGLSLGTLVGSTREILGVLQAQQTRGQVKSISAPSIIATDSIPATMNVGEDVPVLTSQAVVGGVQSGGSNVFSNTVSNQSTGVTLQILARVNSSGVVTMVINQDVSSPEATTTSGISSPSFERRSFQTQITVQDGDTIAIGGAIIENKTTTVTGVPLLSRIPLIGGLLFGSRSSNSGRNELIVFITPKVLYDTNQVLEATEEIRGQLGHINSIIKDK